MDTPNGSGPRPPSAELARLEGERRSVRDRLDGLQAQCDRLRANVDESRAYRERLRAERARLASRLASALSRQRVIATQIQRLDAELRENTVERDALGQASDETNARLVGIEQELQRSEDLLERTRANMADLRAVAGRIAVEISGVLEGEARSGQTLELPRQGYAAAGHGAPQLPREHDPDGITDAQRALREMESILPPELIATGSIEAETEREITEEIDVDEPSAPHTLPEPDGAPDTIVIDTVGTPVTAHTAVEPARAGAARPAPTDPATGADPVQSIGLSARRRISLAAIVALGLLPAVAAAILIALRW